jgi:NDP-sugar pyrophosphorylase family protein
MNFNQLKSLLNHLPEGRLAESNWHRHRNSDGTTGGWIENSAYVEETAYIGPNAIVYDYAWVTEDACISENAQVCENAWIYGRAWISGNAYIYENARVFGDAQVRENARISGNTRASSGQINYDISGEQVEPSKQIELQVPQLPDNERQFLSRIEKIIRNMNQ